MGARAAAVAAGVGKETDPAVGVFDAAVDAPAGKSAIAGTVDAAGSEVGVVLLRSSCSSFKSTSMSTTQSVELTDSPSKQIID